MKSEKKVLDGRQQNPSFSKTTPDSKNNLILKVERVWKEAFPDAAFLPCASNSQAHVYTHTLGPPNMKINGLVSNSPLANNALYSWEVASTEDKKVAKYLNLYEVMIVDIPGRNGFPSTVELYTCLLEKKFDLKVNGKHYHWEGAFMNEKATLIAAIHHSAIDVHPIDFSRRTIAALQLTLKVIKERTQQPFSFPSLVSTTQRKKKSTSRKVAL